MNNTSTTEQIETKQDTDETFTLQSVFLSLKENLDEFIKACKEQGRDWRATMNEMIDVD